MSDIVVVEGLHDEIKVKLAYPDINVVVTNGSQIPEDTIKLLIELSKNNQIIIFTDPDYPGERIRSIITKNIPNAKQAFLRKKDCISSNNKKVGIEHATKDIIKESLDNVLSHDNNYIEVISVNDIYSLGLSGNNNSANLRNKISDYLNIGRPNFKTFHKRLNLLGIDKEILKDIICKVK